MSNVNSVNLFQQMQSMAAQAENTLLAVGDSPAFSSVFQSVLAKVSGLSHDSDALKARFELGDPDVSIGEVMIASQKSSLGLEATIRVRNKILQAYQDVMNMPV